MVSVITAWGIQWTGLPHSPKTDSDCLMKDNPFQNIRYNTFLNNHSREEQ